MLFQSRSIYKDIYILLKNRCALISLISLAPNLLDGFGYNNCVIRSLASGDI